ncbi:MAG: polymer-forming cytoskeletal protein [Actinomycetota bacterium]|jgi:cytoskeletal protein CcmA (bactofilin family)
MTDIKLPYGNLYVGEGVVANGIAIVPSSAVVNGRFDGAIEAKEIDIQGNGEVSGTTQAASIAVTGKLNDVVQAADLLTIGSTGVVRGDVRYGKLEVAKGGELLGSMKQM